MSTPRLAPAPGPSRVCSAAALALFLTAPLIACEARAQSMTTTPSSYSKGYGSSLSSLSAPVALSNRDANGNLVIVDGVMQTGVGSGLYNQSSQTGTLNTTTGVGASTGTALAIGNNITVVTNGSYNTVIVNATQTNNAPVTAGTVLNGQLNLTNGG